MSYKLRNEAFKCSKCGSLLLRTVIRVNLLAKIVTFNYEKRNLRTMYCLFLFGKIILQRLRGIKKFKTLHHKL